MELIKAGLMTWPDVFCWGVLLGITGVKLSEWIIKTVERTVTIHQMERETELWKGLTKMREDYETKYGTKG